MKKGKKISYLEKTRDFLKGVFSDEDDPQEPLYDPVHLGAAVLITLFSMGCLYWLLWTLLVYEGGIFLKLKGLCLLLFTGASLRDLGYEGYPYAMGLFEGWIGNLISLLLTFILITALWNLFHAKKV